jgi:predicted site-specific integrase-resolvase
VAHVGYARVSTLDQDPALQLDALAVAGCSKVFEDRASGAGADRPGLQKALDYAREGDVLIPSPRRSTPLRLAGVSSFTCSAHWVSSSAI